MSGVRVPSLRPKFRPKADFILHIRSFFCVVLSISLPLIQKTQHNQTWTEKLLSHKSTIVSSINFKRFFTYQHDVDNPSLHSRWMGIGKSVCPVLHRRYGFCRALLLGLVDLLQKARCFQNFGFFDSFLCSVLIMVKSLPSYFCHPLYSRCGILLFPIRCEITGEFRQRIKSSFLQTKGCRGAALLLFRRILHFFAKFHWYFEISFPAS